MSRRPYIAGVGPSSSVYASAKQEAFIDALLAEGLTPSTEAGQFNLRIRQERGRSWSRDASILIADLLAQRSTTRD